MKILVTGCNGQLGVDVIKELRFRGHEVEGVDVAEMDITDENKVFSVLSQICPEAVIHCAAWTAVDDAEDENNAQKVRAINSIGTENVARGCAQVGAKMIYLSTDYVFSGEGNTPYKPEDTDFKPLGVYAQTKLDGEFAVKKHLDKYFIVRIAWVFGANGKNFVKTMLRLAQTRDELTVVCDQVGTPTYTVDLARLLADMVQTDKYGVYHATNEGGYISWYEFAKEIFRQVGQTIKVIPVTTAQYAQSKAKRPLNSRLDKSKLVECGFKPLPTWKDALERFLNTTKE